MLPLHPRTQKLLPTIEAKLTERLRILPPLSYRQMVAAEGAAALVMTDSGGVQKEAFWLGVPCVTARDETEWLETQEDDRNLVGGADRLQLLNAARAQLAHGRFDPPHVEKSAAASTIVRTLLSEGQITA